jgi:tetratricopeptide (TPR) repeat protein
MRWILLIFAAEMRKGFRLLLLVTLGWAQSGKVKKLLAQADKEYYYFRNPESAAALYREVLQQDPKNQYAAYRLARCYWYTNETERAVEHYQKALEINADANDTIYLDLGIAQKKLGRYEEAKTSFQEFLKRHKAQDILRKQAEI